MLVVLDECWLHHIDAVLALNLLTVVEEEGLVAGKLLLDGLNRHLVDSGANLQGLHRRHQLLCNVEDIFRKEGPL